MRMIRKWAQSSLLAVALAGLWIANGRGAVVESHGDPELLKLVLAAHESNFSKIETWQGRATKELSRVRKESGKVFSLKATASFVLDQSRDAVRWEFAVHNRSERKTAADPVVQEDPYVISRMLFDGRYYDYFPGSTDRNNKIRNTLVIWPQERYRGFRGHDEQLNPRKYLTDYAYRAIKNWYENAWNQDIPYGGILRVERQDSIVRVMRKKPPANIPQLGTITWRYEFDLSQGGNVTKAWSHTAGTDIEVTKTWTYQKVGDAWLPQTYVYIYDQGRGTADPSQTPRISKKRVEFSQHKLNEPIDRNEFTIEKLGVTAGTRVTDRISSSVKTFRWDNNKDIVYDKIQGRFQQVPKGWSNQLKKGEALPDLGCFEAAGLPEKTAGQAVLICFFDVAQRPSRHLLKELAGQVDTLAEKDIAVLAIQATKCDKKTLDEWLRENNVSFPIGKIKGNAEKTQFAWGVRSLPWLILADEGHRVTAEGLTLQALEVELLKK